MDSCKPISPNKLKNETFITNSEKPSFVGSLEIFVQQARDIHNICIYQNQDVYAKLCLTCDPQSSISTKTINGGGKYPIFNENMKLDVRTVDSSLKCEIWMLSRVKNYLEDQLLGFALVPLSQIVMNNGKLEKEFSLSSTDLFHSPAGFVSLTIRYTGSTPEVMAISSNVGDSMLPDVANDSSIPCEYANLEFPDLNVVSENKMMISEYFGECHVDCPDNDDNYVEDVNNNSHVALEKDGINESSCQKSENIEVVDSDAQEKAYVLPVITINLEFEQPVVQQEIADMYMKSMEESLAKMKLPRNVENNGSGGGNGDDDTSDTKLRDSEKTSTPRVFYGSRAFF